ncbi:hypothetical protein [Clostridium estertheticum]|nr:hypothetical protein [Clostridium estertheticum]
MDFDNEKEAISVRNKIVFFRIMQAKIKLSMFRGKKVSTRNG